MPAQTTEPTTNSAVETYTPPAFADFGKIPRLVRACIVTEKIDGTNAQILVPDDPTAPLMAGSRNRYITPESDNYGFAAWVRDHADELRALGPGRHFGEWWGAGIQGGYGVTDGRKRFSLFNTSRWRSEWNVGRGVVGKDAPPACCEVVPVLYAGEFNTLAIDGAVEALRRDGSVASPFFMRPEGVIVYHVAADQFFKRTLHKDEEPKGKPDRRAATPSPTPEAPADAR